MLCETLLTLSSLYTIPIHRTRQAQETDQVQESSNRVLSYDDIVDDISENTIFSYLGHFVILE